MAHRGSGYCARVLRLLGGCCVLAALAGCSNGPGAPSGTSAGGDAGHAGVSLGAPTKSVAATDQLVFSPATQHAHVGDIVRWANVGTVPHSVTFETQPTLTDPSNLAPGDTWDVKFSEPGTFFYYCSIHAGMAGKIVVTQPAG